MSLVDFLGLDEPSEYDLVRNHLQKVTHPHLTIRGHGDYHIEYIERHPKEDVHIFQYYKYASQYEKWLAHYKECNVEIIKHGLTARRAWEKWGI